MDIEEKEKKLQTHEDSLLKLRSENDRLVYQVKKLEEENYAKTLQLASQRQLIESLQDKVNDSKSKPMVLSVNDEKNIQDLQNKIKDLTSRCGILEQINEETVKKAKKDVDIWQSEAESARKTMRKLEEELYESRKKISEKEEFEGKYKKEIIEKEKLLISLDSVKRTNKDMEESARSQNEEILKLTEIIKTDTSSDQIKKLLQEIAGLELKTQTLTEELEKSSENISALQKKYQETQKKKEDLEEEAKARSKKITDLEEEVKEGRLSLKNFEKEAELIKKSCFLEAEQHMISLKFEIKVQEVLENNKEIKLIEDLTKDKDSLLEENKRLKLHIERFEEIMNSSIEEAIVMYKAKFKEFESKISNIQNSFNQQSVELNDLKTKQKHKENIIEEKQTDIAKLIKDLESSKKQIALLQEDCENYNSLISQITLEKAALESTSKQKDSKYKTLSSKVQLLESQLQDKNKEILNKENEIINIDRQLEILRKKLSSRSSKIKQIASEQIDSQKKKIESNESEIKMLKEMLKSVQTELKYKQQEIQKIKKPSPKKNIDESPLQAVKAKEPEYKLPAEIKDSPFKKQPFNIFKAKSPFKVSSRKGLVQDDTSATLLHIIKGYLTSYVLCEKEKKEMTKVFVELDQGRRGILDKSVVLSKCEESMFDSSLLGIYGKNVDYKDFVEINYHNQLQQIHRDLDINFSQILPGSISLSELKIIKQALRPLHKQIWDVIVDRIEGDYPKEVDLMVVKQVLSQAQISL